MKNSFTYLIAFLFTCLIITSSIGTIELAKRVGVNVSEKNQGLSEISLILIYAVTAQVVLMVSNDE